VLAASGGRLVTTRAEAGGGGGGSHALDADSHLERATGTAQASTGSAPASPSQPRSRPLRLTTESLASQGASRKPHAAGPRPASGGVLSTLAVLSPPSLLRQLVAAVTPRAVREERAAVWIQSAVRGHQARQRVRTLSREQLRAEIREARRRTAAMRIGRRWVRARERRARKLRFSGKGRALGVVGVSSSATGGRGANPSGGARWELGLMGVAGKAGFDDAAAASPEDERLRALLVRALVTIEVLLLLASSLVGGLAGPSIVATGYSALAARGQPPAGCAFVRVWAWVVVTAAALALGGSALLTWLGIRARSRTALLASLASHVLSCAGAICAIALVQSVLSQQWHELACEARLGALVWAGCSHVQLGCAAYASEPCACGALDLSGLKLTALPPSVSTLGPSLMALNVSANRLASLNGTALAELHGGLRELLLNDNGLELVPSELGRLTRLIALQLDDNSLASLPTELGKLAQLRSLRAHSNQLTELPTELGALSKLALLDCGSNQLSQLPSELDDAPSLQLLIVDDNRLSELSSGLLGPSGPPLRALLASRNQLVALEPAIGSDQTGRGPGSLQWVGFSSNALTELTSELLVALTYKRVVDVSDNNISALPADALSAADVDYLSVFLTEGNPLSADADASVAALGARGVAVADDETRSCVRTVSVDYAAPCIDDGNGTAEPSRSAFVDDADGCPAQPAISTLCSTL
jgi:hypothetical protein